MTGMTDAELDEIEKRAKEATPGPLNDDTPCTVLTESGALIAVCDIASSVLTDREVVANARFFAAARTDVPRLVAEVRRLKALVGNGDV